VPFLWYSRAHKSATGQSAHILPWLSRFTSWQVSRSVRAGLRKQGLIGIAALRLLFHNSSIYRDNPIVGPDLDQMPFARDAGARPPRTGVGPWPPTRIRQVGPDRRSTAGPRVRRKLSSRWLIHIREPGCVVLYDEIIVIV
jgi:hypothetical protein